MKKILFTTLLLICSVVSFAQQNNNYSEMNNELKINMSNLIGFKWLDIGYERILNEESAIGFGTLISLDNSTEGLDGYRTFSITPYYRHFFSYKYAQGFFIEAFTMIHSGEDEEYYYSDFPPYDSDFNEYKYTDLAVGISVGGKWVTERGFVAEIYVGIGRDMLNNSDLEVVGRGGVSIGYRFQ